MPLHILFLHYILFMNTEIGFPVNYISQSCHAFNSTSTLKYCNRVLSIQTPTDAEIAGVKSLFVNQPFTWFVDFEDRESQNILEHNNLSHKGSIAAMCIDLDSVKSIPIDNNIAIKTVSKHSPTIEDFICIVSHSFVLQANEFSKVIKLFQEKITPDACNLYVGFYHGKAVATALALYHKEAVSLHWISTLPEFRNKGLGYAITQQAFLDAKNYGYKQAILLSSDAGKSLYERLGFKQYCLYSIYGNY